MIASLLAGRGEFLAKLGRRTLVSIENEYKNCETGRRQKTYFFFGLAENLPPLCVSIAQKLSRIYSTSVTRDKIYELHRACAVP